MKRQHKKIIGILLAICVIYLLFRKSKYSIIVPNEHVIGTGDDEIVLIGAQPVSPLLSESITYDFLTTLAALKGANDVGDLLMTDFQGRTVQEVQQMLEGVNLQQLITQLQQNYTTEQYLNPFEQELAISNANDSGTTSELMSGIDCTKCKWDRTLGLGQKMNYCKYKENGLDLVCAPGICSPINDQDPWPNTNPWKPKEMLTSKWGCNEGKVNVDRGMFSSYTSN